MKEEKTTGPKGLGHMAGTLSSSGLWSHLITMGGRDRPLGNSGLYATLCFQD